MSNINDHHAEQGVQQKYMSVPEGHPGHEHPERHNVLVELGRNIFEGFKHHGFGLHWDLSGVPHQKRHMARVHCFYKVSCSEHHHTYTGTVVDMSLSGMRLVVPHRVYPGTHIAVRYWDSPDPSPHRPYAYDTIHGRVVWCRKKRSQDAIEVGLAYHDSEPVMSASWVFYFLHQMGFDVPGNFDRRHDMRVDAMMRADMSGTKRGDDLHVEGKVINLSVGGALFESAAPVALDTLVRIEIGPFFPLDILNVRGRVVSCTRIQDSPAYQLSVHFEHLTEKELRLAGQYIRELMRVSLYT